MLKGLGLLAWTSIMVACSDLPTPPRFSDGAVDDQATPPSDGGGDVAGSAGNDIGNACKSVGCGPHGTCGVTVSGSAACYCEHGYTPSGLDCAIDSDPVSYCEVFSPETIEMKLGDTPISVVARIYAQGMTEQGNGESGPIKAQLGYTTKHLAYPVNYGDFVWVDAAFESDGHGSQGNDHAYSASFTPPTAGNYRYIYRFSKNGGKSYSYCDTVNIITESGYSAGRATVVSPNIPTVALETMPTRARDSFSYRVNYSGEIDIDLTATKIYRNGALLQSAASGALTYDADSRTFTVSESGLAPGKYSYLFRVVDKDGTPATPLFVPLWIGPGSRYADFGWRDAFIYQLMTDRFLNGDPKNDPKNPPGLDEKSLWEGGDYAGIIKKLQEGYFTKMGVNALWISSPIVNSKSPHPGVDPADSRRFSSYHSYHPLATGYTHLENYGYANPLEPAFGSAKELHALVNLAHSQGIRVIPDFVANHVHKEANIYQQNKDWFHPYNPCHENWGTHRVDCWFTTDMPDFDYQHNPALRKAVIDHAIWMIQEYNFDGFRADALKHMADSFVTDFKAAIVKHIETTVSDHDSPDQAEVFYIVGESLGGWARYHTRADMVQGQVNEGFSDSIQHHIFADGSIGDLTHWASSDDASYLTEQPTLENGKGGYPGAVMGNFFGNHDKVRALTHAGGDHKKLRLAQTFLMTAPINIPMLYQGDDIGMLGGPDPDNRRPMKFGNLTRDESASLDHIRKLGLFRARNRPLRYGKRSVCDASYDAAVFTLTHDDETVVVGLNRGSAPFAATCAGLSGTFKDLAGNAVTISDGKITVPAQSSIALGK